MAKEPIMNQMAESILDNGLKMRNRDKEHSMTLMVANTLASFYMERDKAEGLMLIILELDMWDNGRMTKDMVEVLNHTRMERNMKDFGIMMKRMALESTFTKMAHKKL